jgi:hypothetical protein
MAVAFLETVPAALARRPLTEADAVDIWIARWLRIRRKDLVNRYGCDPRRLYEIWARYPGLIDRVDFGPHARHARATHPDQLAMFE